MCILFSSWTFLEVTLHIYIYIFSISSSSCLHFLLNFLSIFITGILISLYINSIILSFLSLFLLLEFSSWYGL